MWFKGCRYKEVNHIPRGVFTFPGTSFPRGAYHMMNFLGGKLLLLKKLNNRGVFFLQKKIFNER